MNLQKIFMCLIGLSLVCFSSCERSERSDQKTSSQSQSSSKKSIQIKGSDTMVNLGQAWAEHFMKENSNTLIAVTGGGSGTGIAALLTGTCDISEASRKMKDKEFEQAKKNGIDPQEFTVALDGLAVAVNLKNPVSQLTIQELADIFTGKIKSWKDVGGSDAAIVILSREVNSGTHVYFKEHVLRGGDEKRTDEFDKSALLMPSSQAIVDEIAQNPDTIGYYGMGYQNPTQKILAVAKDKNSPYSLPTIANVKNRKYYISRPLLMYTNGKPQGVVKEFIDFVLSSPGQEIVNRLDFVPMN